MHYSTIEDIGELIHEYAIELGHHAQYGYD